MTQGRYAKVNGLEMYYEIHGTGEPLILLHGGFGVIGMFEQNLPALAENRQVIGVELQGHGHTADIDRPLSFEQMADDVAALISHLGLANADVLGYSLGGGVALQTAIRHPDVVRRLVLVSAPCKSDGWYPEVLVGMRSMNAEMGKTWVGSPMYQAYASVAPRPDDWPALVGKMGQLLSQDYDWSEAVSALKSPVMLVVGDADSVRPAHAVEFFALLGGGQRDANWDGSGMSNSRLAILPGITHYDIFASPALAAAVIPFLDTPMPQRADQTAPKTIDEYIAGFPPDVQEILEQMRMTIRKAAPDAEETIKYRMPTFILKGNLVHFAAFKEHIGFYPVPTGIEKFRDELSVYKGGKGSVKFPLNKPIPYDLISRIVKFRVQENLGRAETNLIVTNAPV